MNLFVRGENNIAKRSDIRKKISEANKIALLGNKNHFKGIDAILNYQHLHKWIRKNYGKPKFCEHCLRNDRKQYDWANKTGILIRIRSNWIRLCRACHIKYDKKNK